MPRKYAFDTFQGRLATWLRGHILFTRQEVEAWKDSGVDAVLLQRKKSSTAFVIDMKQIHYVNRTYYAAELRRGLVKIDLKNFGLTDDDLNIGSRYAVHVQEAIRAREDDTEATRVDARMGLPEVSGLHQDSTG